MVFSSLRLPKGNSTPNELLMKTGHNYYVYILQCSDDSYYTGVTNDLERRLWEHHEGCDKTCYTCDRRPVELKYFEHYHQIKNAIAREKQLKGWSRKRKKHYSKKIGMN
jgi:putative endonuclease